MPGIWYSLLWSFDLQAVRVRLSGLHAIGVSHSDVHDRLRRLIYADSRRRRSETQPQPGIGLEESDAS